MICPVCYGKGGWREDMGEGTILYEPCNECKRTGRMDLFRWLRFHFWQWAPEWFIDFIISREEK